MLNLEPIKARSLVQLTAVLAAVGALERAGAPQPVLDFIACAPADVTDLLVEIAHLRKSLDYLRDQRPCAGTGAELRTLLDGRGPESIAVVRLAAVRELSAETDRLRGTLLGLGMHPTLIDSHPG